MDFLAALFALFSPVLLTVLTAGALLIAVLITWRTPSHVLVSGLALLPLLALTLGPMVISSSTGIYVVPWWAHSLGTGTNYVGEYLLTCAAIVVVSYAVSKVSRDGHGKRP